MPGLHVGLISGTSMDGIDAVAVDLEHRQPSIAASCTRPFEDLIREQLDRLRADPDNFPASGVAWLDAALGEAFADAAVEVIQRAGAVPADIAAIGSHGQTVLHRPDGNPPQTLQIGDPSRIAARTGTITVADFRRADLAAGGQAAPLAPLLHQDLFSDSSEDRAVVNLGGIANVTLLPAEGTIAGFDTGPANCLLDLWYRRHHPERFDDRGGWAAGGAICNRWLETLLDDPYFRQPVPKSTGIEQFSPAWLEHRLPDWAAARPRDVQATLAELSAAAVALNLIEVAGFRPDRILLCGGGVHNADLVARIRPHFPMVPVESTGDHGLDPDFVEATLFAWLARERLAGRRVNTPPITGARHPVLAGAIHSA